MSKARKSRPVPVYKIGTVVVGALFKKYRLDSVVGNTAHVSLLAAKTNQPIKKLQTTVRDFHWMHLCTRSMGPTARAITDGQITRSQLIAICAGKAARGSQRGRSRAA